MMSLLICKTWDLSPQANLGMETKKKKTQMWDYDPAPRTKILFLREKPSLQVLGQSGDPGKENPKLYKFLSILPRRLLEHTVNSSWVMSQRSQVVMYYTYLRCNSSPLRSKRLHGIIINTL